MAWSPNKSTALMLGVFAIILFGVHKNDANTQAQIVAAATKQAELAHTICVARNAGILKSNIRWENEKLAWTAAAVARRSSAKTATPKEANVDRAAARVYENVADSIVPYPLTPCGDKP